MSTTIASLLNSEANRLNERKAAIDEAEEERKRVLFLNTNAVDRQKAFNNIYLVIVVMLFVVAIIKMIYQIGIVPEAILDVLTALIISAGLIYSVMLYDDIMRRSNMDFNRLDLGKMSVKSQAQMDREYTSGNLGAIQNASTSGQCSGAACCSSDQTYNTKYSVCVANTVPAGKVLTNANLTTGGVTTYRLQYGADPVITQYPNTSNVMTTLTAEIVTALSTSANYKYCNISAGQYDWLPVTSFNLKYDLTTKALKIVLESDPNWVGTGRTAYVPATLSTRAN